MHIRVYHIYVFAARRPPPAAPTGELVTVKGHPPTPSKNSQAVSMIWEKVLNEELFQVGDDEVRERRDELLISPLALLDRMGWVG